MNKKLFNTKHTYPKYIKQFLLILPLFLIILLALFWNPIPHSSLSAPLSVSQIANYAQTIVQKCTNSPYHPTCYEKEIPKLMDTISMEDAFKVTAAVQTDDHSYLYCHVLGHKLSAKEVDKDPSKWEDVVARCPSGVCSNGCIHGGFQEKFRTDHFTNDAQINAVLPDLQKICEKRASWDPTGLEQGSCYHALGHLTMYITDANTQKASQLCDRIVDTPEGVSYRQICYDGVFMQLFQPLETEDFDLVKGKVPVKRDAKAYCLGFDGKRQASCLSESWPLFRDQVMQPSGLIAFCERSQIEDQPRCYSSLFYVLTIQFNFDLPKIKSFCSALSTDLAGQCFANTASRLIETDYRNIAEAVNFCVTAEPNGPNHECLNQLVSYSTYNLHAGSKAFNELCTNLPEPWKSQCTEKNKA